MSEAKHTKGPLEVGMYRVFGLTHHAVVDTNKTEAVAMTGIVGEGGEEETRSIADAHLFAAATDMLAALEEVMRAHGIYDQAVSSSLATRPAYTEIFLETGDKIRAAIAKAKGGA